MQIFMLLEEKYGKFIINQIYFISKETTGKYYVSITCSSLCK